MPSTSGPTMSMPWLRRAGEQDLWGGRWQGEVPCKLRGPRLHERQPPCVTPSSSSCTERCSKHEHPPARIVQLRQLHKLLHFLPPAPADDGCREQLRHTPHLQHTAAGKRCLSNRQTGPTAASTSCGSGHLLGAALQQCAAVAACPAKPAARTLHAGSSCQLTAARACSLINARSGLLTIGVSVPAGHSQTREGEPSTRRKKEGCPAIASREQHQAAADASKVQPRVQHRQCHACAAAAQPKRNHTLRAHRRSRGRRPPACWLPALRSGQSYGGRMGAPPAGAGRTTQQAIVPMMSSRGRRQPRLPRPVQAAASGGGRRRAS